MIKSMTKLKVVLLSLTVLALVCLFSTQSLAKEEAAKEPVKDIEVPAAPEQDIEVPAAPAQDIEDPAEPAQDIEVQADPAVPVAPSNNVSVTVDTESSNYVELITTGSFEGASTYSIDEAQLTFANANGETIGTYIIAEKDKKDNSLNWKVNGLVEPYVEDKTLGANDAFVAYGEEDPNPIFLNVVIHGNGSINFDENPIVMSTHFWVTNYDGNNIMKLHDSLNYYNPNRDFDIVATPANNASFEEFLVNGKPLEEGYGRMFNPGQNTLDVYFTGGDPQPGIETETAGGTEIAKTFDNTTYEIFAFATLGICAAIVLVLRRKFSK